MINTYSASWFELFLEAGSSGNANAEAAFIARNLPQPDYRSVVDLCCGTGRHAGLLAAAGYRVTAVDNSPRALEQAKSRVQEAVDFVNLDMRHVSQLPGCFDAFVNIWQSFGSFDEETNLDILRQIAQKLTLGGRLIMDIYNREFFQRHQGMRCLDRAGVAITERKRMTGNRLQVTLTYDDRDQTDSFDWQLYNPEELTERLTTLGFGCVVACTDFAEATPVTPERPRMQLVFELGLAAT